MGDCGCIIYGGDIQGDGPHDGRGFAIGDGQRNGGIGVVVVGRHESDGGQSGIDVGDVVCNGPGTGIAGVGSPLFDR